MNELPPNARHRLIVVRDLERFGGDDRDLRRRRDKGELVRVRRGCYVPRHLWDVMDSRERHITRAHAVASNAMMEPVFSHLTAAALHKIPISGSFGRNVHVTSAPGSVRRNQPELSSHSLALDRDEIERAEGLLVTSRSRTLIDLALTLAFPSAVVALDHGLANGVARSGLHGSLERRGSVRRGRSAALAIDFADPSSGSPGESHSRGVMHVVGCVIPQLQVPISDRQGRIGIVDFYWPDQRLIGEFDGAGKYLRDEYLGDRSSGEAVVDEKRREDRMRATERGFVRWGWDEANDPARLATRLINAGVPLAH